MMRWLSTATIAALFALVVWIPDTPLGRRGTEARVRADVPGTIGVIGEPLPDLPLLDLNGRPLRLSDYRGHPLLVTFERSVDW